MPKQLILIYRNLTRHRYFALLNICGLAISICSAIVIFQYVSFELSFDQFNENDLYRVINRRVQNGEQVQNSMVTYSAVGPALVSDIPEVINQSRVFPFGFSTLVLDDNSPVEIKRSVAVERSFFEMFSYPLLAGNLNSIFERPNELALTLATAKRLFPNDMSPQEMIGSLIKLDRDPQPYELVAIVADLPENSHLQYELFMSYATIITTWQLPQAQYDWSMLDFRHYVQLMDGRKLDDVQAKLPAFSDKYFDNNGNKQEEFSLQPVTKAYLFSGDIEYEIGIVGDAGTVYMLTGLAIILLILGWINFINLSTAFALERFKNTSIRKVLGASKWQLQRYFLMENLVVNGLSLLLGFGLSVIISRLLISQDFAIHSLAQIFRNGLFTNAILFTGLGILLGGIAVSTLYGALISLPKNYTASLKSNSFTSKGKSSLITRIMLIFQFAISILFFITGLVVHLQNEHVRDADLGISLEDIWVVTQPRMSARDSTYLPKIKSFKSRLMQMAEIEQVSTSQRVPGQQLEADYSARADLSEESMESSFTINYIMVDAEYLDMYDIALLAGRNLNPEEVGISHRQADKILISESTLPLIDCETANNAIGKRIFMLGQRREIVGVIEDYRHMPVQYAVSPLVLLPVYSTFQIAVKTPSLETMDRLKDVYENTFTGSAFEYVHLKTSFERNYAQIDLANKAFYFFTAITIIIACSGLISMACFNLMRRLKEIGMRKVLGATKRDLILNSILHYGPAILIAGALALPMAYFFLNRWLNGFEESVSIGLLHLTGPFMVLFTILATLLAMVTLRISAVNPIKVIRPE